MHHAGVAEYRRMEHAAKNSRGTACAVSHLAQMRTTRSAGACTFLSPRGLIKASPSTALFPHLPVPLPAL